MPGAGRPASPIHSRQRSRASSAPRPGDGPAPSAGDGEGLGERLRPHAQPLQEEVGREPQALGGDATVAVAEDRVLTGGEQRRDRLGGARPDVRVAMGVGRHQPVELEQDKSSASATASRERGLAALARRSESGSSPSASGPGAPRGPPRAGSAGRGGRRSLPPGRRRSRDDLLDRRAISLACSGGQGRAHLATVASMPAGDRGERSK